MLKSIQDTQKLFRIEDMGSGKVDVEASKYLLSLPEHRQIEVLSESLENLKRDMAKYDAVPEGRKAGADRIVRAQLQLLIQVIEGLLGRI